MSKLDARKEFNLLGANHLKMPMNPFSKNKHVQGRKSVSKKLDILFLYYT